LRTPLGYIGVALSLLASCERDVTSTEIDLESQARATPALSVSPLTTLQAPLDGVVFAGDHVWASARAVALSDETLVVRGLRCVDPETGPCALTATVFTLENGNFAFSAEFDFTSDAPASWEGAGDRFDGTLAITGDALFIGDPVRPGSTTNAESAVYVVRRVDGAWLHVDTWRESDLTIGSPVAEAGFGAALATSDNRLAIAAPGSLTSTGEAGRVYVIEDGPGGPTLLERIHAPLVDGTPLRGFGRAVALSGATLVVRAADKSPLLVIDVSTTAVHLVQAIVRETGTATGRVALVDDRLVAVHAFFGPDAQFQVFARRGGAFAFVSDDVLVQDIAAPPSIGVDVVAAGDVLAMTELPPDGARLRLSVWNGTAYEVVASVDGWQSTPVSTASLALSETHLVVADRGATTVAVYALSRGLGAPCSLDDVCASGACRDGVCCDESCGGSNPDDCMACSVAAGGSVDGACTPSSGNVCDDGDSDACTFGSCSSSACVVTPLACDDHDPCTSDACDADTGCIATPLDDGATCDDDDPCTASSTCVSGLCVSASMTSCDDGNPSTVDSCDPQGCASVLVGEPAAFSAVHLQLLDAPLDGAQTYSAANSSPRAAAVARDVVAVRGRRCVTVNTAELCATTATIFERQASGFVPMAEFEFELRALPSSTQYFGRLDGAIAATRDVVVVGDPNDVNVPWSDSVAHVIRKVDGQWVYAEQLNDDGVDTLWSDRSPTCFGYAVAVDDKEIVVGAPCETSDDGSQVNAGAVYRRSLDGAASAPLERLTSPDAIAAGSQFGIEVALREGRLVATTFHDRSVSVFDATTSTSVLSQLLTSGASPTGGLPFLGRDLLAVHHRRSAFNGSSVDHVETYRLEEGSFVDVQTLALAANGNSPSNCAFAMDDDVALALQFEGAEPRIDLLSRSDDAWAFGRPIVNLEPPGAASFVLAVKDDVLVVADRFSTVVSVYMLDRSIGAPCDDDGDCTQGFCRDGVCCDSACGDGAPNDCLACSVAMGAPADGLCAPTPNIGVCAPTDAGVVPDANDWCDSGEVWLPDVPTDPESELDAGEPDASAVTDAGTTTFDAGPSLDAGAAPTDAGPVTPPTCTCAATSSSPTDLSALLIAALLTCLRRRRARHDKGVAPTASTSA